MTQVELTNIARRVCLREIARRGSLKRAARSYGRIVRRLGHNGPSFGMAQAFASAVNTGPVAVWRAAVGK